MKLITTEIEKKFEKYPIGSQEEKIGNAEVIVKFFNPTGVGTWYITEGEKIKDNEFEMFGYCHLGDDEMAEMGYVYLSELENIQLPMGLKIERDLYIPKGIDLMEALKRDGITPPKYMQKNYIKNKNERKNENMNNYESIIIIKPNLAEEEKNKVIENYKRYFESLSDKEVNVENLGKENLAYEIKGNKQGNYAVFKFCANAKDISDIERKYRIDDNIMKFITVREDPMYER